MDLFLSRESKWVAYGLLAAFAVATPLPAQMDAVWKEQALLLYNKSANDFNQIRFGGKSSLRLKEYVEALEMMHSVPLSADQTEGARARFREIIALRADDDVGIASQYYLNRILQSFQLDPDPVGASAGFLKVFKAYPSSYFGQLALVKHVMIELLVLADGGSISASLKRCEDYADSVSIDHIRCSLYSALAEACTAHDLPRVRGYMHLRSAYEIGYTAQSIQGDLMMELATLAEEIGDNSYAVSVYEDFARRYPKDERSLEAKRRIARLQAN